MALETLDRVRPFGLPSGKIPFLVIPALLTPNGVAVC
jgi:hypothetical protein